MCQAIKNLYQLTFLMFFSITNPSCYDNIFTCSQTEKKLNKWTNKIKCIASLLGNNLVN
uniref:Uncharacterized protein n=1 Tax=Octopus bimaculoides TaxID=37653 RepID=A0A0L8IE43_OCTBM